MAWAPEMCASAFSASLLSNSKKPSASSIFISKASTLRIVRFFAIASTSFHLWALRQRHPVRGCKIAVDILAIPRACVPILAPIVFVAKSNSHIPIKQHKDIILQWRQSIRYRNPHRNCHAVGNKMISHRLNRAIWEIVFCSTNAKFSAVACDKLFWHIAPSCSNQTYQIVLDVHNVHLQSFTPTQEQMASLRTAAMRPQRDAYRVVVFAMEVMTGDTPPWSCEPELNRLGQEKGMNPPAHREQSQQKSFQIVGNTSQNRLQVSSSNTVAK